MSPSGWCINANRWGRIIKYQILEPLNQLHFVINKNTPPKIIEPAKIPYIAAIAFMISPVFESA
jgi:hypothetical protein